MGKLSETDRRIIESLRQEGVLADVEAHRLDQSRGVVMVTCSDGDQMPDIFSHQTTCCKEHRSDPRIHVLALNGGALLLPNESPLNIISSEAREFLGSDAGALQHQDDVLIWNIKVACEIKGIHTVALYTHAPCGAAGLCELDMKEVVGLLIQAKMRLRRTFPDKKFACFCHIDYGDDKRHTYFVPAEVAKKWLASHPG